MGPAERKPGKEKERSCELDQGVAARRACGPGRNDPEKGTSSAKKEYVAPSSKTEMPVRLTTLSTKKQRGQNRGG